MSIDQWIVSWNSTWENLVRVLSGVSFYFQTVLSRSFKDREGACYFRSTSVSLAEDVGSRHGDTSRRRRVSIIFDQIGCKRARARTPALRCGTSRHILRWRFVTHFDFTRPLSARLIIFSSHAILLGRLRLKSIVERPHSIETMCAYVWIHVLYMYPCINDYDYSYTVCSYLIIANYATVKSQSLTHISVVWWIFIYITHTREMYYKFLTCYCNYF